MPRSWKTGVISGGLIAWFSIASFVGYNHTGLSDDTAEYVNNPVRLLYGEVPYRDFWMLHPPGEVYLPAAVYRLGCGVNGVLLASAGVSVLVGLAAFWVGRNVAGNSVEGVLAAALVFLALGLNRFSGRWVIAGCVIILGFASYGLLEYIVHRYGNGRLVVAPNAEGYARYLYWLHFAEGSLMSLLLIALVLSRVPEGKARLLTPREVRSLRSAGMMRPDASVRAPRRHHR
jgi:hypothetical protein